MTQVAPPCFVGVLERRHPRCPVCISQSLSCSFYLDTLLPYFAAVCSQDLSMSLSCGPFCCLCHDQQILVKILTLFYFFCGRIFLYENFEAHDYLLGNTSNLLSFQENGYLVLEILVNFWWNLWNQSISLLLQKKILFPLIKIYEVTMGCTT